MRVNFLIFHITTLHCDSYTKISRNQRFYQIKKSLNNQLHEIFFSVRLRVNLSFIHTVSDRIMDDALCKKECRYFFFKAKISNCQGTPCTHIFWVMKAFFIRRTNSRSFKRSSSSLLVKHDFERLYQTEYLNLEQNKYALVVVS